MKSAFSLVLLALALVACSTPFPSQSSNSEPTPSVSPSDSATLEAPQIDSLLLNPGAEEAENLAKPAHWYPDSWGENSANLSWESNDSFSGKRYLSVTVSNHESGDAKWIPESQKLVKNAWYEYKDHYRSDGRSRLILNCTAPGGERRFQTVWQAHKSDQWVQSGFRFYNSELKDCNFSVLHILDRNGFLHTDHHQLTQVEAAPLTRPLVSITFDDIWKTATTTGIAELNKHNWKGSFYIAKDYTEQKSGPEFASATDVKELIKQGHEVGSHSTSHPLLTSLDAAKITSEVRDSHSYAQSLGALSQGIAYPFGDFNQEVEDEVKQVHDYARTSLVGLNDKTTDPYRLRIVPITSETSTSDLFTWVDDAKKTSTWVIFLFHDLKNGTDNPTYTTSATQYAQLLTYIDQQKVTVLPVNKALSEVKAQQNVVN